MTEDKVFIKILNEETAAMLIDSGFSYMTEKINANQIVYVFESCDELTKKILEFNANNYSEHVAIEEDLLRF